MDYSVYKFSTGEYVVFLLRLTLIAALFSFFFYRSFLVFPVMLLAGPLYYRIERNNLKDKRRKKLCDEFAETLYSVNANMRAGYSLENAFMESYKDISRFYGEKSIMAPELIYIRKGIEINRNLEDLIKELGERSGVEDIEIFALVFETAKRNGGNVCEVLSSTADTIREKTRLDREIETIISEKRFELLIMECVPFMIFVYIEFTSKGYFDICYHNIRGVLFMTVCLLLFVAAVYIGSRIIKVRV